MGAVAEFLNRHSEECLESLCSGHSWEMRLILGEGYNVTITDFTQYDAIQAFCREHQAVVYRPIPQKPLVLRCPDEETYKVEEHITVKRSI